MISHFMCCTEKTRTENIIQASININVISLELKWLMTDDGIKPVHSNFNVIKHSFINIKKKCFNLAQTQISINILI